MTGTVEHSGQTLLIGRYEVVRSLGSGGMAQTWLCRLRGHRGFSRDVVVKTLKPEYLEDLNYHAMFLDEARIGAMLEHPNIPRVEAFDSYQGMPYIVQEYVEGPRLFDLVRTMRRQGRIDLALGCRIVADVARALDYVHHATDSAGQPLNLIHRDVSTSNIIVAAKGRAKLIDFGVASFEDREAKTDVGFFKGKLQYMAPEAVLGEGRLSSHSDLFSLGVVLYVVCTGVFPKHDAPLAVQLGDFPPPRERSPEIGEELNALILQLLDLKPNARPDAKSVVRSLEGLVSASGVTMTDADVSSRIAELFPRGAQDWENHATVDARTLNTLTGARPRPAPTTRIVLAAVAGSGLAAMVLTLMTGAILWWWWSPGSRPDALAVADVSSAALPLVAEAEDVLARGNVRAAMELLEQARVVGTTDADVLIRMTHLASEARRFDHRRSVSQAMERGQSAVAREALYALLAEFPSDEQGLSWLEALGSSAAASDPGARPGRLVVRSTAGALLTVDGTPVGTMPAASELQLPPGRHRITLRKEGLVTEERELQIEASGTYTLDLMLTSPEPVVASLAGAGASVGRAEAVAPVEAVPEEVDAADDVGGTPDAVQAFHHSQLTVRQRTQLAYPDHAPLPVGTVVCTAQVFIDERGVPYDVVVLDEPSCPEAFHDTTVTGVMRWRWYPPKDGKEKVRAQTRLRVTYERE